MLADFWKRIAPDEAKILARWATMTTFTYDLEARSKKYFTQRIRDRFLTSQNTPKEMEVWISRTNLPPGRGIHQSSLKSRESGKQEEIVQLNFGMLCGKAFLLGIYRPSPIITQHRALQEIGMIRIFPDNENGIVPFEGLKQHPQKVLDNMPYYSKLLS
jgi:hypothetical protein